MFNVKTATILAATALVVAVFGSTPLGHAAASMVLPKRSVGAAQLKTSAVVGTKIAKNAITGVKVKNGTLMAADFKAGQLPAGPQGPKGDKGDTGAQGAPGTQGIQGVPGTARAYGRVAGDGTLTRSKNVTGITHPFTGVYCIALAAGIDVSHTGVVATIDYALDYDNLWFVNWYSPGISCPAGQLQILTFVHDVQQSDNVYWDQSFSSSSPDAAGRGRKQCQAEASQPRS